MAAAALEGIVIGDTVPGLQVRTIAPRTSLRRPGMIGRPAPLGELSWLERVELAGT